MTRKVISPDVQSLANMTGQAMWNTFVNSSESKSGADKSLAKQVQAFKASELEERLDLLNLDFVNVSADITAKQVGSLIIKHSALSL